MRMSSFQQRYRPFPCSQAGREAGRTERGRSGCPGLLGGPRGLRGVPGKGMKEGAGGLRKG